jgi:hypothetical protein
MSHVVGLWNWTLEMRIFDQLWLVFVAGSSLCVVYPDSWSSLFGRGGGCEEPVL